MVGLRGEGEWRERGISRKQAAIPDRPAEVFSAARLEPVGLP